MEPKHTPGPWPAPTQEGKHTEAIRFMRFKGILAEGKTQFIVIWKDPDKQIDFVELLTEFASETSLLLQEAKSNIYKCNEAFKKMMELRDIAEDQRDRLIKENKRLNAILRRV